MHCCQKTERQTSSEYSAIKLKNPMQQFFFVITIRVGQNKKMVKRPIPDKMGESALEKTPAGDYWDLFGVQNDSLSQVLDLRTPPPTPQSLKKSKKLTYFSEIFFSAFIDVF